LDERVFPFLGPLKVAAVLENTGYKVDVLDLSGIKNYLDVVEDYAKMNRATHYGLTATTPQFPAAVKIAEVFRRFDNNARIIIGGTHATLVAAALKKEKAKGKLHGRAAKAFMQLELNFDTVVAGDGEEAIFQALAQDAPGYIDADDRKSPYFLNNMRLDATPFPARHLIDMSSYHYKIDGVEAQSLIAQLGCPYKCGFCGGRASPMLRNIRTRSTENIIEEMKHLYHTYGIRGFMFYDDELNVNKEMVAMMQAIAKTQRDLGVEWKLRGFVKSERFTDEQASAMYEAGFRILLVGFESGSPRILENIQKIATQEDNTRCMEIAHRHNLKVKALMSLGHPGESPQTIDETRRWLLATKPMDFDATVITPYPGSPYYDDAEEVPTDSAKSWWVYKAKNGDSLFQEEVDYAREADYYKGDPNDGYQSHVWTKDLSRSELVRLRNGLESTVRDTLGIPFNPSAAATLYEHSMGQTALPHTILRSSIAA
jgi:radical SAM superfamily enzyme YgiQ (UPF0313 family)